MNLKRRPKRKSRQGHEESTTRNGSVVPQGSGNDGKKCGKSRSRFKQRRGREAFKKVQDLFRKRRCAQVVLDGSWDKQASKLNLEELEPFWREMFEKESVIDNSEVDPIGPVMWDMIKPISLDEVTLTINAMKNGSPGLDGSVSA